MSASPSFPQRPRSAATLACAALVAAGSVLTASPAAAQLARDSVTRTDAARTGAARTDAAGAEPRRPAVRYVALGDSYTAAPLIPTTNTSDGCLRSSQNYPAQVAAAFGARGTLVDVSCTGATTGDALTGQATSEGPVPAQVDAVTKDTTLVTIGLGGNDNDVFTTLLYTCYSLASTDPTGAPCTSSLATRGIDLVGVAALSAGGVERVVRAVRARAPRAQVLVVGYPVLVPETGFCTALGFAAGDYPMARAVNKAINAAVRAGAAAGGAQYVDVGAASAGHDVCAGSAAWVNGILGFGPDGAAPYHPFRTEQRAVASMILGQLRRGVDRVATDESADQGAAA